MLRKTGRKILQNNQKISKKMKLQWFHHLIPVVNIDIEGFQGLSLYYKMLEKNFALIRYYDAVKIL